MLMHMYPPDHEITQQRGGQHSSSEQAQRQQQTKSDGRRARFKTTGTLNADVPTHHGDQQNIRARRNLRQSDRLAEGGFGHQLQVCDQVAVHLGHDRQCPANGQQ
jgi:hypothetical protein